MSRREIIESSVHLRTEHVVGFGRAILDAVNHLHGEGLLYCDMKPATPAKPQVTELNRVLEPYAAPAAWWMTQTSQLGHALLARSK